MKRRARTFFKYFFLVALIAEAILLIAEALMPGKQSSQQSSAVGGFVDDIITDVGGDDEAKDVPPESIAIQGGDFVIDVGKKKTLATAVSPADTSANYLKTVWTSDNEEVASVSGGVVTARALGTANITVTLEGFDTLTDTVRVTVREIFAESFSLKFANGSDSATVAVGSAATLRPVLTPSAATAGTISYQSADTKIATVSASGAVKGVAVGTTTVTATYTSRTPKDGQIVTLVSDPVTVTVIEKVVVFPSSLTVRPAAGVETEDGKNFLYMDGSASLKADLLPANTTEKAVVWSSSDESVLTIDARGKITPVGKGSATVTAASASASGVSGSIAVEVRNRTLGVTLMSGEEELKPNAEGVYPVTAIVGRSVKFSVTALPHEVFFRYTSDDEKIAEVNGEAILPYLAARTVDLHVTVADNPAFSDRDGNLAETFTLRLTVQRVPFSETVQGWALMIRKLFGHFGAFLLLGLLAGAVGIFFERKDWKWRLITMLLLLVCGFAFAGLTEILQMDIFTVGRGPAFTDVLIDYSGFAPAVLAVYGIYLIIAAIVEAVRRRKTRRS